MARKPHPTDPRKPGIVWRNSAQLRGVRSQLMVAVNGCDNGAHVEIDIKTARNLIEVCVQAIHTEEGHGT